MKYNAIYKYGRNWDSRYGEIAIEMHMFFHAKTVEAKKKHFRNIIDIQYPAPAFEWHRWCDMMLDALVRYSKVCITGPAAASKSSFIALWNVVNWSCMPTESTNLFTSTSLPALETRVWSEVIRYYRRAKNPWPGKVFSEVHEGIQIDRDLKKSKLYGVAVKSGGSESEAVDRIIGVHNPYMMVNIDEATSVPEAIVKACSNLNKGCKKFQLVMMGNAMDKNDPHGRFAEPKKGWSSITEDDEMWETKAGGVCVHLDGYKSPALEEPERLHFLINEKQIEEAKQDYGGSDNPEYMRFVRGWWGGSMDYSLIITEPMIEQHHLKEKPAWKGQTRKIAALDPAFEGGDRRAFTVAEIGENTDGKQVICFHEPKSLQINTDDRRFIHDRLAEATINAMMADGIKPRDMIIDTTGEGQGAYEQICMRLDSDEVHMCEFGGAASTRIVNPKRMVTARMMYHNAVAEYWLEFRRYCISGLIYGMDDATLKEFTQRRKGKMINRKQSIETKTEMKNRGLRSPDYADAAVMIVELAKRQGLQAELTAGGTRKTGSFERLHRIFRRKLTYGG